MNYSRIELEPKIEKRIKISFVVFFTFIISFLIMREYLYGDKITRETLLNTERHTKVINIYHNSEQHNFLYVKYSDGKSKVLEFSYQIGDSISKNKGDSIEYIFRNGEVIKNNLLENYLSR